VHGHARPVRGRDAVRSVSAAVRERPVVSALGRTMGKFPAMGKILGPMVHRIFPIAWISGLCVHRRGAGMTRTSLPPRAVHAVMGGPRRAASRPRRDEFAGSPPLYSGEERKALA
jgi:hypothetical protein